MNAQFSEAVAEWKEATNEPIRFATPDSEEGEELIELTWDRAAGDGAYIELFRETGDDVVLVQYGTIAPTGEREQRGTTRLRSSRIKPGLTEIKNQLDGARPQLKWAYRPKVEIGNVSSLKLR